MSEKKKLTVITDYGHKEQVKKETTVPDGWELEVKTYKEHGEGS